MHNTYTHTARRIFLETLGFYCFNTGITCTVCNRNTDAITTRKNTIEDFIQTVSNIEMIVYCVTLIFSFANAQLTLQAPAPFALTLFSTHRCAALL